MFDIVICHGPNDDSMLELNLNYNKKNIIGYNNIYIITHDINLARDDCIIIHESIFPFSINILKEYITSTNNRYGWYLQQLLKLYAYELIENIKNFYLVIDCDTLFLKPTLFFENNIPLYNYGTEHNLPYFIHMRKLDSNLTRQLNMSGICHHMMFSKTKLCEFKKIVETDYNERHSTNFKFWQICLICIDKNNINGSGFSEYEMYFNYMLKYNPNEIKIRKLKWMNTATLNIINNNSNFDYISYHHYQR